MAAPDIPYKKVARDFVDQGEKQNRRPGECATRFCRGRTSISKNRLDGKPVYNKHCGKCLSRRQKARNPISYFYRHLKKRALQRGHEFTLTLEEWTKFVADHDLLSHRGKTATCMSVDRHDPRIGYVYSNLKVLTVSENSSKGTNIPEDCDNNCPF